MKKIIALLSAAMMIIGLAGCGNNTQPETESQAEASVESTADTTETEETEVSTSVIMNRIKDEGYFPEDYIELTAADMPDYYGIETSEIKQCSAVQNSSGWQDEFIIIEATDSAAVADIISHLNEHIQNQCDQMRNYDASMYDIVSKCGVETNGNYVALFITKDYEELNSLFNSYFA